MFYAFVTMFVGAFAIESRVTTVHRMASKVAAAMVPTAYHTEVCRWWPALT